MHLLKYLIILSFMPIFISHGAKAQETDSAKDSSAEESFIEKYWGSQFGRCYMSTSQYQKYMKAWLRYRIITRARYNLLAKSYRDITPNTTPTTIDLAFQFQSLSRETFDLDQPEEETIKEIENALQEALSKEKPALAFEQWTETLGIDRKPKNLQDYLEIINSNKSPPYSRQDGYDVLYKALWDKDFKQKSPVYLKTEEQEMTFNPEDLRAIDAIARTLWGEVGLCDDVRSGHYQLVARVIQDRADSCENSRRSHQRFCREKAEHPNMVPYEQALSKSGQFSNWKGGEQNTVNIDSAKGLRLGKDGKGLIKLIKANKQIKRSLCPTEDLIGIVNNEATLKKLKEAYKVALKLYRDPKAFKSRWKWKGADHAYFYFHGQAEIKTRSKNIQGFITPDKVEVNFSKATAPYCPQPYIYKEL